MADGVRLRDQLSGAEAISAGGKLEIQVGPMSGALLV
jgi:hypothetical protein